MNIVVLYGNLTRDPEVREVSDTHVANFTVAISRKFTRKNGEKDQETTFVDCEVWDSAATFMSQYMKKGDPILVHGALKLDIWEKEGQKRSKLKVRATSFEKIYRAPKGANSDAESGGEPVAASAAGSDDDVPF